MVSRAYTYALTHADQVLAALIGHLWLVGVPVGIGLAIGLPLGLLSARAGGTTRFLIQAVQTLRVIPSLAILFLAIPWFGLGFESAAIALVILVLPPIVINTDVAFRQVDPVVREAAVGMGMTPYQVLVQVEIPLALPTLLAGIKTATLEAIASATLAAFIGAGGLGSFIVLGFALYDPAILLVGAIPVALLALGAEVGLSLWQQALQPPLVSRTAPRLR